MADSDMRNVDRLPIKLIMPKQGKERKIPSGGSPPKPFRLVNIEYRKRLINEVSAISKTVLPQSNKRSTIPVRVKVLTKAVAKSHRPERLFSGKTCPIIGGGRLGELFVKATVDGLSNLNRMIESDDSQQIVKELSIIETIEPITPAYRRKGIEAKDILSRSPRSKNGFVTRVRLFNFEEDEEQTEIISTFENTCHQRNIHISSAGYAEGSFTYAAECQSVEDVDALSKIVGVQSITNMPLIRAMHPGMANPGPLPKLIKRQDFPGDIPIVAVVDTGITDQNPDLNAWIVGRENQVAPQYRNTDHGTFVAGLICWSSALNPTIAGIDASPCGVFDFQVIPNNDPGKGQTDSIGEPEFLQSLDSILKQHANEYKVWNLSLNTEELCSLDDFSELAEQLDNLQEKYQVSFVISAGNYNRPLPLLSYPRSSGQLDIGRISPPADSVLGVTVGSVSHIDYTGRGPKIHEPSAFSRHGAGPNYVIKPDLVHYGGACSCDASSGVGIRSLNGNGSAENMGTSFAAPLVSRVLAQIYHQITPTPSPVLARALLTHHARDPRTQGRVPDGEENYFGFGLPSPVPYCLECTPYSSTLVFDDVLRPGYFLEWDNFPYPTSLSRDGKYFGEIWMTVAFSPARGARWGSEYCETHIDAHFGVYHDRVSRETGEITSIFKGLVPPEHKNPGVLYESYQVENLRKWAPVRTYYGNLGENGESGSRWRLMLRLLTRHGIEAAESFKPQPFSLIVTISDPEKRAPVYDEMARNVRNRFQSQNLAIRATARIQGRT